MTVAAIMKVTTDVPIHLYANRLVLTARIAEYKLGVAHSAQNTTMVLGTIGLAVKPS